MINTVHVLCSSSYENIYVGYASNLIERFKSHNELGAKGWNASYRPQMVIYCEYFTEKSAVIKREKALKGGKGIEWIHHTIDRQFNTQGFIST